MYYICNTIKGVCSGLTVIMTAKVPPCITYVLHASKEVSQDMEQESLKVIQSIPFTFYEKEFEAHLANDRRLYVVLIDICRFMGIDHDSQRKRILRDRAINDCLVLLKLKRDTGREEEVLCLRMDRLPYWLGSIDVERIKPELMNEVLLYKREFADAAWAVFRSSFLPQDILAELDSYLPPALQQYYRLADDLNQQRIESSEIREKIDLLDSRISAVENQITGVLTSKQKLDITRMVADLSNMLVAKGICKEIGSARRRVYGGVNKEFRVQSYHDIPSKQFNAVHNYLIRSWQSQFPDKPLPSSFRTQGELF